jgi:hypothetical protein
LIIFDKEQQGHFSAEMSMAALPRRTHGGDSGSLFFLTVAARQLPKKRKFKKLVDLYKISPFSITVAARQRQMFSRDGHLCFVVCRKICKLIDLIQNLFS